MTPPIKGFHKGLPADKPAAGSSEYINNIRIRGFEGRITVTQRLGLDKWGDGDRVGEALQPVVAMCSVSSIA